MDALSPSSPVTDLAFMKGAQVGGTEAVNNWLGYIMHLAPGPTLLVLPTLELARDVGVQRIATLVEETPVLHERVGKVRKLSAEFPGGLMFLAGANSGASLRSKPILWLPMDEVDDFPGDVGGSEGDDGQGDPVLLASKRTTTFARAKRVQISTPKNRGASRITTAYENSDRRKYFVPCPHCGHMDWLQWSAGGYYGKDGVHHHICYELAPLEDGEKLELEHVTVWLKCSGCGGRIEEHEKTEMLARGEWRPTRRASGRVRGYHLSALYSPLGWKSWRSCVLEFEEGKHDVQKLKVFVNTVLGEPFEETRAKLEPEQLLERREPFDPEGRGFEVPHGVAVLTAGVDVQNDRLEVLVVGFGAGEESWLIAHEQIFNDPGQDEVWAQLDEVLTQTWKHASGREMKIRCTAVDSGHHTDRVYRFCVPRAHRHVRAVKGSFYQAREIAGRPSKKNRYRLNVWPIGTDSAKDMIYSRLRIIRPGVPGYIHLPDEPWCNLAFLKQLLAETKVTRWIRGKGNVRIYENTKKERNEALDLMVYALAALNTLGPTAIKQLGRVAGKLQQPVPEPAAADPAPAPAPAKPPNPFADRDAPAPKKKAAPRRKIMRRPGNSWVNRWKP